ncbi:MAG: transcription antitermination factor NusB [Candidatus Binatia bacterium]
MSGPRRRGREIALQALYRMEITGDESGEGTELLWQHFEAPPDARQFAVELVRGVVEQRERIDHLINDAVENWNLARLSRVDLNILRIGAYELLATREIPTSVVLDEAIEIARRYGSDDSSQFVNGVLDSVAGTLGVREAGKEA